MWWIPNPPPKYYQYYPKYSVKSPQFTYTFSELHLSHFSVLPVGYVLSHPTLIKEEFREGPHVLWLRVCMCGRWGLSCWNQREESAENLNKDLLYIIQHLTRSASQPRGLWGFISRSPRSQATLSHIILHLRTCKWDPSAVLLLSSFCIYIEQNHKQRDRQIRCQECVLSLSSGLSTWSQPSSAAQRS